MQRLSMGSPAGKSFRPSVAADEEAEAADENAAKAVARAPAPDRSIHLVPVLTLLCLLVLFLLSHDPSAALTASPVLATVAVTARSLEATVTGAGGADASSGVYWRLKEHPRRQQQSRGRRLGIARRRR